MRIDQRSKEFEAAHRAFWQGGPPGVLRRLQNVDSYPGERVAPDDPPDPQAYQPLPTSMKDERQALADAIGAYLEAADIHPRNRLRQLRCRGCGHQGDRTFARDGEGVWRDVLGGERGITPEMCECDCGSRRLELVEAPG
jgi:hypothetical protein